MDKTTLEPHLCQVKGHEQQQLLPYLCISQRCDQKSRYVCQLCLLEVLHYHNDLKPQYLSKEMIMAQFQSSLSELKQENQSKLKSFYGQYQETLQILTGIEKINEKIKNSISQENLQISQTDELQFECLKQLLIESFFQLNPDNINKILHISEHKLNHQKMGSFQNILEQQMQQLIQSFELLKSNITSLRPYDYSDQTMTNMNDKIRKNVYSEEIFPDFKQNYIDFSQSKISPNNQYLAIERIQYDGYYKYSIDKYSFDLIELSSKKSYNLKFKNNKMDFLQFSSDSQKLYYKENNEPFYCFNIHSEHFQEYRHFPELMSIQYILDTKLNQTFVINQCSELFLLDMEYQYIISQSQTKNAKDLIFDNLNKIAISAGDCLEFWNGDTGLKVHQGIEEYKLDQLQLRSSKGESDLLACDQEHLYIFKIYYSQDLIKVSEHYKFQYDQKIVSYNLVLDKQYCIIFGEQGRVKIYDKTFQIINHLFIGSEHDKGEKQFDIGQCSNNLSAITVVSNKKNLCLYLTAQVQK
ncbi:hypothetical protein pb186bvf_007997 [Paramecium bursaria]